MRELTIPVLGALAIIAGGCSPSLPEHSISRQGRWLLYAKAFAPGENRLDVRMHWPEVEESGTIAGATDSAAVRTPLQMIERAGLQRPVSYDKYTVFTGYFVPPGISRRYVFFEHDDNVIAVADEFLD
jgi:hypothetical protein